MANVTVKQLAEDVGAPVDRLLKQMQDAGLPGKTESDLVSDDEKQTLLAFLKKSHGESSAEPRKITLKRKTTTTLKTAGGAGRAKTVNVEVRKKRTYIKRVEPKPEVALKEEVVSAPPTPPLPDLEVSERQAEKADAVPETVVEPVLADLDAVAVKVTDASGEESREEMVSEVNVGEEDKENSQPEEADSKVDHKTKGGAEKEEIEIAPATPTKDKPKSDAKKPKKKHKEHASSEEEGKPKVKSAGHRGQRQRLTDEPIKIAKLVDDEAETPQTRRARRKKKAKDRVRPVDMPMQPIVREVAIPESISVADLANKMSIKAIEVIKSLMGLGIMATINQTIDQETAVLVAEEKGHKIKLLKEDAIESEVLESVSYEGVAISRAPVVSVMGHVDHGKTSLLDYIRRTKVAAGESGGITQHIGAYHVETGHGMISFLDTPGHAAFTAMRARGAKCTDIVILVVAADDGVMPQTEEAVQHARSAGVPIVVAVNKIDKESADPDRVRNELSALEVIPEDWGGDVQFVNVSAHSGEGVDGLLDAVLLQAEMLELSAVPDVPAKGVVIESRLDKGRGAVSTVLIQNGTLHQGDIVIAGMFFGKVRAMADENGQKTGDAGPSIPVEILGLNGTPDAGDDFLVVADEKKARELTNFRLGKYRTEKLQRQQAAKLENLFENMGQEETKTLNLVLKTDVRGSLEALTSALSDIGNDEVAVNIVSSGVGGIAETDANLALATNAVILGFNVRADSSAKKIIEREAIDLRYYSVIYEIIDDVRNALTGMLAPEYKEEIIGVAEVRETFKSPKFGQVAGCMVVDGAVHRNKPIRVLRDNIVIFEGELESLRRFKDDVPEVRSGIECGIGVKNYDVKVGDKIEVFDKVKVARKLD
ncbi:MAG: translation initiation factor IF-2 [Gammaproteobacteria bacterium]|nr:MAG: translation initiation factor IF-2 [Gammaproteobacteria bacterium]